MKKIAAVLLLAAASSAMARTRAVRSTTGQWQRPACEQPGLKWLRFVDPDGTVHYSADYPEYGARALPILTALALGTPANVLWAVSSDGAIHRSADAGCTWSVQATAPVVLGEEYDPGIVARHASRVYVYPSRVDRRAQPSDIVRLTGGTMETFRFPDLAGLAKMDVDPRDPLHLRAISKYGLVWESYDGAATWRYVDTTGTQLGEVRSVAFHPQDFDHILAGTKSNGLWATRDGGRTWTRLNVDGFDIDGVVFSPADPRVIYTGVTPSKLQRSTDGGETFTTIDISVALPYARLYYIMHHVFAPHPRDAYTWASEGNYGTGVKITGPEGTRTWGWENVNQVVWAPSGTMYYFVSVTFSR